MVTFEIKQQVRCTVMGARVTFIVFSADNLTITHAVIHSAMLSCSQTEQEKAFASESGATAWHGVSLCYVMVVIGSV